jgi:chaperonin GroES
LSHDIFRWAFYLAHLFFSANVSVCQGWQGPWHGFGYDEGKLKYKHLKKQSIMNIKPLGDRVLVVPAPAEEKIGGIIIPDTAKEKPLHGTIKAVGQGTKDEEMVLKAGDEVLYGKYSGTELEFEGEKYLMMRQSDVLAIIEK